MGSEAGGGSTATVDPTQQSRCPINAAEYVCHGYTAGAVWWRQDEALTDTQDIWITRTNHGASCVTPAALRHNSAGGLRVLNGVTHSGWWGRVSGRGFLQRSGTSHIQHQPFFGRIDTERVVQVNDVRITQLQR